MKSLNATIRRIPSRKSKLEEFALRVLTILENQEEWNAGTVDDIAGVALYLQLAIFNPATGLFKKNVDWRHNPLKLKELRGRGWGAAITRWSLVTCEDELKRKKVLTLAPFLVSLGHEKHNL